jgi:hypothetical protein
LSRATSKKRRVMTFSPRSLPRDSLRFAFKLHVYGVFVPF